MTDIQISINSKTYPAVEQAGHHLAIADLKLSLKSGEFICLVGPSGCGKTTLLNIIAGLDNDYVGKSWLACNIRIQNWLYFPESTFATLANVRENIELVLDSHQSPAIIDPLLEVMQLTQSQNVYPERLSLGMSRRVSIIRAFAVDPDVLLMDEPFVSLDAPTARQVRELLLKLWQQRPHTVLFVTHDLREAIALADRLIFLSAAPMTVISEITVPVPRTERHNENAIEAFRQQLIKITLK